MLAKIQGGNKMTYQNVYAAYPAYRDNIGNVIEVILKEGRDWDYHCFVTFKHHWAEAYGTDFQKAIMQSEEVNGKKRNHVLLFSNECCVIPGKVRKPRIKDDGAYGYIVDEAIKKVEEVGSGTKITFINDDTIILENKISTINKYRRRTKNLRKDNMIQKGENGNIDRVIIYK
jgi:hypothetical protein